MLGRDGQILREKKREREGQDFEQRTEVFWFEDKVEKKILVLNLISFERRKGEDSLSREMKAERIELREKIKLKIKINTFERIN